MTVQPEPGPDDVDPDVPPFNQDAHDRAEAERHTGDNEDEEY